MLGKPRNSDEVVQVPVQQELDTGQNQDSADDDRYGEWVPGLGGYSQHRPGGRWVLGIGRGHGQHEDSHGSSQHSAAPERGTGEGILQGVENSRRENPRPISTPRKWPPIKDRGEADRLEGFTNTMRALDPRPAARAASERESSSKRMANMAAVARPTCIK